MRRPAIESLLFATMLAASTANAEDRTASPPGDTVPFVFTDDCHLDFERDEDAPAIPSWLQADGLTFVPADEGQALPLNTLVVMPSRADDDEAMLIIEFAREDLNQAFVQAYFFDRQALIPVVHPYSRLGVEYILTDERLILKIHPDVVVHLRDDSTGTGLDRVIARPEYQRRMFTSPDVWDIFRRDDVIGTVIFVSGDVHVSDNPERVRAEFDRLHAWVRVAAPGEPMAMVCRSGEPDGGGTPPQLFPPSFPPRVVPGR